MRHPAFPKGQEFAAVVDHARIGYVFKAHVKEVSQEASGFVGAKPSIEKLLFLLLSLPCASLYIAIAISEPGHFSK